MQTTIARISAVVALACCLAAFTGTAVAGNGNGNGNAAPGNAGTPPGQEKKADETTAATAEPATQPAASSHGNPNAPGLQKKTAAPAAANTSSNGQAKQAARADVSTPGVKPSKSTSHWTKCTTGGTAASATCSGNGPKADGSKQYGNGTTAAQIAVSRGGAGVVLTGPGNSQPHKVAICPKKGNKSGGVDAHAVKGYSTASCAKPASAASSVASAATVTAATQPQARPKSASTATQIPAAKGGGTTAGGVLGTETRVAKSPTPGGPGGVLGAAAKLRQVAAKGTLPFTGFPLWIATLGALALIGTGLALRSGRLAQA